MDWNRIIRGSLCVAALAAFAATGDDDDLIGRAQSAQVPIFEYDPTFPKPLPENWAIGPIGGLAVDRQDHLYVVQRPGTLLMNERFSGSDDKPPKADCCIPAPPVPGQGYDWPQSEHGVFVDHKDIVWLAGNSAKDHQLLTFTRQGKFLRQFGKAGMSKGSADTANMRGPANLVVDPVSNEVYVADGYGNRRVIVLDAETFAFKRMWGAYGNRPSDIDLGPYDPDAPPAQQFRLPHNISISKDGFVYVADRPNNRIQVFRKDGTFVKEAFISKRTLLQGAASGFALSPDPQQRFLYMIDGANHHVWILNRGTLQLIARFGQQGLWGGSLNVPHAIAVDSKGNIYVGENFDARRFQRFLFKGLGTPKPGTIPPTTIVR
jgi:DNA-binding beta-propeller fold protein YncE